MTKKNQLESSSSLYLKQHKDQPIHWYNYGEEAINSAQIENKPIFLSIGYSSCHWCHVMAQESFSNPTIANYLNDNFICIKVDKEEFPDIDQYYQKAALLFKTNGGWPLSAFLMPNLKPFYIGTYFPPFALKNEKEAKPNFMGLLMELNRAYTEEKELIEKNGNQVAEFLSKIPNNANEKVEFPGHFPGPTGIMNAIKNFRDEKNGGFGEAPKFPQFSFYEWAIEQMLEGMIPKEDGDFILHTLDNILMGGITDQARGGIHRYSTDEKWIVPHFEKMLYDQAGFIKLLAKLSLVHPTPQVFDTLISTLKYLEDEMLFEMDNKASYFFSSQDADSEGVEGLFFTFTLEEFEDLLNKYDNEEEILQKNSSKIFEWFNVTKSGNFTNSLNVITLNQLKSQEFYTQENWEIIRLVKKAILSERRERIPPATDTKGIASWNFMLISALVDVIQYIQIDVIKHIAQNLLNKVIEGVYKTFMEQVNDKIIMKHSTTQNKYYGLLEDFVMFSESQLRLYEISGNTIFKQNFKDSMTYIQNEFLNDNHLLTRAKSHTQETKFPNQIYDVFDNSFKSPVATFINLSRRAALLFMDNSFNLKIENLKLEITHSILKINPISAGESLRALTYPDQAYRSLKVPSSWATLPEFLELLPYFLSRFVIDYVESEDSNFSTFQICSIEACELVGNGIKEFSEKLTPKENT